MNYKLSLLMLILLFCSCTRTENGLVFGTPKYEKRDIAVTAIDLKILQKTKDLLSYSNWQKDSVRLCSDRKKLSLYCALEKASIEINGKYRHRQAALQEVRFAIDDLYKSYWSKHRIGDFNGNQSTTFDDIQKVLTVAINRIQFKLGKSSQ